MKLKKLRDQVIVITGSSSGIGLTTAEMAADAGARVVLSSRNEEDLRKAVNGIRARGGRAIYVVADVADADAVEQLAARAVSEFGGFDTWVNNAGVALYGKSTDVPLADKRRLFDINFWGVVHGCRAAVPHLRRKGGAIINMGSILSDRAAPLLSAYSAAKHAVKGYTDALRMELEEEGAPISISLVKPSATNTPFTEHARNYMEADPEFPPPVYAPEEVARAILRCAEKPIRDITVGGAGWALTAMGAVAPRLADTYQEKVMIRQQQKDEPSGRRDDALYRAGGAGRRRGTTSHWTVPRSAYTRAALSDVGRALPILAASALVAATIRNMRRAG